jgi:lipid-A-disaccharide synthase-like uncharacterized protein
MTPADHLLGFTAGALTSAGMTAQLIQILWTGRSVDVSNVFFTLMLIGVLFWLYYGLKRRDPVLIVWNFYGAFCCAAVLALKYIYG